MNNLIKPNTVNSREEEADLLIDLSANSEALIEKEVIDAQFFNLRDEVSEFDPSKLDKYNDSLLYRVYYVAKRCKTASTRIIANNLQISKRLLEYYIQTYPKVGLAIQVGVMDARDEMKETLVEALFTAAKGQTVSEQSVAVETVYNEEGAALGTKEKITTVEKYVPPNVSAATELMKRLDPAWVPKVDVNVSGEVDHNYNVTHDVNVAVDYKQLSPEALKELLNCQKPLNQVDNKSYRDENNKSVVTKGLKNKTVKDPKKKYTSTASRVKKVVEDSKKEVSKARKTAKKDADAVTNKKEKTKNGRKKTKINDK